MNKNGPHKANNKPIDVKISSADERKTVIVDNDFDGIELEDRMWLFWKGNKNTIIFTIIAIGLILVGVPAYKHYKNQEVASLANEYANVSSAEQREAFAKKFSGKVTAGVVLLESADEKYLRAEYAEAAKLYNSAMLELGTSVLADRAMLGRAMSLLQSGDLDNGKVLLKDLFVTNRSGYSNEAGIHLGVLTMQSGKNDEAKVMFETISNSPTAGVWGGVAKDYLQRIK